MRALGVAATLALMVGCWNFGALGRLYHGTVDGGTASHDLGARPDLSGPCGAAPTPENCFNNIDDDCDGVVNNGCPDHIELGAEHVLSFHGGSGGSPKPVRCPPNFFVVATSFWGNDANSSATGIELRCASFTLTQGPSSYGLMTSLFSGTVLAQASEATQTNKGIYPNTDCSSGLQAATWFTSNVSLDSLTMLPTYVVSGFSAHCASTSVQLSSENKLGISFSRQGAATDENCYMNGSLCLGPTVEDDCDPGEVLVGFDLELGSLMDGISGVCAPVVVVYK
jgi:hypothetical protein